MEGMLSGPGSISITLVSGNEEATRANEGNVEFYIGKTHLYFYTSDSDDAAAVLHKTFDAAGDYTTRRLAFQLSEGEVANIFSDDATTCTIYAISNLPEELEEQLTDQSSINEIKQFPLETDFSQGDFSSFVMDAKGTVTLDRSNSTMTATTLSMARAAVKISLNVFLAQSFYIPEDGTYSPANAYNINNIKLYNTLKRGLVDGTVDDLSDSDYITDYSNPLTKSYFTTSYQGYKYYWYTASSFYSYPCDWSNEKNRDVHATICVPWKLTTSSGDISYKSYNYQIAIPINTSIKNLERNKNYSIYVYLSVLGGTLDGEVVTPGDLALSYEVADWTDDGTPIDTELDQSHYLVVQDNTFEVFNENSLTFEYQSCDAVEAYVSEISYVSTRYDNDETIYLYKANYDESSNSYNEVTDNEYNSLSDHTSEVRKSKKDDIIKYIDDHVTTDMLTNKPEASDNVDDINGRITLTSAVSEIAEKLYRPVKYTVVVVNGKDHNQIRQTVTITQYPSKYIEFGAGGNVFVNGYYARLVPDAGYTQDSLPEGSSANGDGYKSYNFVTSTYDESNKYYSSTENNLNTGIGYGSTGTDATKYASINSSYEYVRGNINSTTVSFKQTIDVHVTAFSESDNYFTINNGNDRKYYKIGDPRIGGNFTNMQSHSTSYTYKGNELYEYYVKGGTHTVTTTTNNNNYGGYDNRGNDKWGNDNNTTTTTTTYYDRYVEPWPDVDKIKVGGTTTSYDEIISPLFKIQSTYGAAVYAPYFKVAQKRCATYQEAGYPAGRWRLPTLAEIAFIVKLQSASVIDLMFNKNEVGYWTCTGSRIIADDSFKYTANYDGTCYVRCVYDLWYWGSDQVKPTHEFYPMPTKQ
jgi:hypothetical protein